MPPGMLTRAELARQVANLPVGGKLTVERIGDRRVRITRHSDLLFA